MRGSTLLTLLGAALAVGVVVAAGSGPAVSRAGCGPEALGLARTLTIETAGGPRYGKSGDSTRDILRDREVVLTFDDGPHKAYTRPILDALDRHCVKATFFMVGQRALAFPDIAREVARRGHSVGSHTWTHQDLGKIEPDAAEKELELGISAVHKLLGDNAAPFFRFPYLSETPELRAHLRRRDTANISIDIDSHDFKTRSATKVISNVMHQLDERGRGIILFHDIQPSTAGAIDDLLVRLKESGYRVVHLVAREPQATLAEYDRRIDQSYKGRRFASLPAQVPVAQRSFINPAWEIRIVPEPSSGAGSALTSYPGSQGAGARTLQPPAPRQPEAAAAPAPREPEGVAGAVPRNDPPPQTAQRRRPENDWRDSVFKSW